MANISPKINRSDVYPVGTVVSVYPAAAAKRLSGGKPSGTALTSGTVDAAGQLTFTIPGKTAYALWAEVAGEHRVIRGGDPTPDAPAPTLRERLKERRVLAGAGA